MIHLLCDSKTVLHVIEQTCAWPAAHQSVQAENGLTELINGYIQSSKVHSSLPKIEAFELP